MKRNILIIGRRGSGKTLDLIKMSAKTGIYILVVNKHRAGTLFNFARKLGYTIPYPVTIEEYFRSSKFDGSSIRRDGLYIDDADDVFKEIFKGIHIHAATVSCYKGTPLEPEIKALGPKEST